MKGKGSVNIVLEKLVKYCSNTLPKSESPTLELMVGESPLDYHLHHGSMYERKG